jgi:hypothetical protein
VGSVAAKSEYAKKCKEVERLQAQILAAHATFDDTVDNTTRTRSHKVKRGANNLSQKIEELVIHFKKSIAEH